MLGEEEHFLASRRSRRIRVSAVLLMVVASVVAVVVLMPPLIVVESKSMQHSETASHLGIIDTGDILVLKKVSSAEVRTYLDGVAEGYRTFGQYGDVVVYRTPVMVEPIIHRALLRVDYNRTGSFDIPSLAKLAPGQWSVPRGDQVWWNLKKSVDLYDIGYAHVTVHLNLSAMLFNMQGSPHGGLITMGDNNWWNDVQGRPVGQYDQKVLKGVGEPIRGEWLLGRATGEIPWFGLLKLWADGTAPDYTPVNSQVSLVLVISLMIGTSAVLNVTDSLLRKRGIHMFGWISNGGPWKGVWVRFRRYREERKLRRS